METTTIEPEFSGAQLDALWKLNARCVEGYNAIIAGDPPDRVPEPLRRYLERAARAALDHERPQPRTRETFWPLEWDSLRVENGEIHLVGLPEYLAVPQEILESPVPVVIERTRIRREWKTDEFYADVTWRPVPRAVPTSKQDQTVGYSPLDAGQVFLDLYDTYTDRSVNSKL